MLSAMGPSRQVFGRATARAQLVEIHLAAAGFGDTQIRRESVSSSVVSQWWLVSSSGVTIGDGGSAFLCIYPSPLALVCL